MDGLSLKWPCALILLLISMAHSANGEDSSQAVSCDSIIPTLSQCSGTADKKSQCNKHVNPHSIVLIYSGNDALCKPLIKLYDKLNANYDRERDWELIQSDQGALIDDLTSNIEDRRRPAFKEAGFQQPKPYMNPEMDFGADLNQGAAYQLILSKEGKIRIVYLEDKPSDSHGGVETKIILLKKDFDPQAINFLWKGHGKVADIEPSDVSIILFPDERETRSANIYRKILAPYTFCSGKNIGLQRVVFQRPFIFKGDTIFVARDEESGLVYKINEKDEKEDICRFTSAGILSRNHYKKALRDSHDQTHN